MPGLLLFVDSKSNTTVATQQIENRIRLIANVLSSSAFVTITIVTSVLLGLINRVNTLVTQLVAWIKQELKTYDVN